MKIILLSICIFIIMNLSIGDTIKLKNGRILQGLIINSSGKKVSLKQDNIVRIFSAEHIKSVTFSRADSLLLKNGQNLICKVVNENDDDIIISLAQGVDSLNKDNVSKIMYNKAAELSLSLLPETGDNFVNEEVEQQIEFRKSIYLKVFLGSQSGHVKDNTDRFINSSMGIVKYGMELGYNTSSIIGLGFGIESYIPVSTNLWRNRSDYSYSFYYLNSNINLVRIPSSKWYLTCEFKTGQLSGRDNIFYNFDVGSRTVKDKTYAFELNIKFLLREEYLEYTIGLGYLYTKTLNLNNSVDRDLYRKINFSGLSIDLGISLVPAYYYHSQD